jgi:hypothetical protein
MTRLAFGVIAWIGLATTANASLTRHKFPSVFPEGSSGSAPTKLTAKAIEETTFQRAETDYVLTARTEVSLDGKPCAYASIPSSAIIVRMELAADKRTVLRVHFRSRK